MLDGEVVVQMPEGRSDFHALEKELKRKGGSDRLIYYVFDILYYEAFDLRGAAFLDRKRVLAEVLRGIEGPVKLSEHLEGDGPTIWHRACDLGLEGIVSKRADARYYSGRSPVWIKATYRHRDTFAVVGWQKRMEVSTASIWAALKMANWSMRVSWSMASRRRTSATCCSALSRCVCARNL